MERSGAPSGWSQYQYEQGSGYPSQLGSSHQSFLTSTGCRFVGPIGAYGGGIPTPHPQSACHFDTTPNNKNVHNSLSPRFSANVQHRTEIFARDEVQAPPISTRRFFSWYPSSQSGSSSWNCDVCSEEFHLSHALRVHFHQFHLNPHHLSPEDSRLFRLSNFLVKLNEDIEIKTEYPGLYRCHECFNVFNKSCSLRTHLLQHQEEPSTDSKTMVVAKMAPKIDKLSREDFEDVRPKERRPKAMKPKLKVTTKISKKSTIKLKVNGVTTTLQQTRKSRKSKQSELQSEPSDEFNSDSDVDKDKDYYSNWKQTDRKSLVTRQKLALGLDKVEASRANRLDMLSSSTESENGSHKSDQVVNGHVLESIDNVLSHVKNEFMIPEDEINLIKTMDENKSPGLDKTLIKTKTKDQKQKRRLKNGTLKTMKQLKNKLTAVGDLDGIKSSSKKIRKKRKTKKLKNGIINGKKSKLKSPVKDKSSPKKLEVTSRIKDLDAETSINNTMKKRSKSDKLWRLKIRDHSKASNLVQQLVQPASDFICLKCSKGFQSYGDLRLHKLQCKGTKIYQMCTDSKNLDNIKKEIVDDNSQELFEYVTGSVTDIPETSFNNMHGKISDLNTEDAQKFSSNPLNEIGLVKLNYSGSWSVKDVWESGGWEPRDDQLTWQQYELSSAISKQMQTDEVSSQSELELKSELEDSSKVIENSSEKEIKPDNNSNKLQATPSVTDLAHCLTRKLTTQIVSRKAPLITCSSMDRGLVTKLAKLPWSEQRKVKEKFDAALVAKRTKRVSLSGEPGGQHLGHSSGIRQSAVTNRLDLKQLGRSVKYMKVGEREAQAKERDQRKQPSVMEGTINGEWEIEHSFLCSVCGIEYDDVLEILHHKWESHPHCLVTHVSLKEGVVRPPALLYPQVGPSTIYLDPTATPPAIPPPLSCSKCSEEFSQTSDEGRGQFHSHLLTCGGVKEQEGGKRRKRKRRGHGGGLKSTVRMLQKGNPTGNSRDGTDTEEGTPRKRTQPIKKVLKAVPLIPTHTRTTRFKETKKKEARKLAARERRSKGKVDRPIRTKEDKKGVKNEAKDLEKDKSDKLIVAEVLEKVISTVEKVRGRPGRPRMVRKSKDTVKGNKGNHRERRLSVVRARQMDLYREQSSESEQGSEESEAEVDNISILEESMNEDKKEQNIGKKLSAIVKRKIPDMQTSKKPVLIKIENDENLQFVTDLDRVNPYVESPVRGMSPSKTPVRGLSPLKALFTESTSSGSSLSPIRLSKDGSRSSSLNSIIDLLVDSDSNEENHDQSGVEKEISSPKSASRSLKRLETNLVSKLLLPTTMEDDSKRRSNFHVTYRSKFQPSRFVFPIELKISAIARVESGETQVAVARDLNINTATLAAWWLRRSEIKGKFEREVMLENGDDMRSNFAISNLIKKFKKEARGLSQKESEVNSNSNLENYEERKLASPRKSFENRIGLPLHVKAKALKQVIGGKTQAAVAKELSINPSTVAHWWAKKDLILGKYETNKESNTSTESDTQITSDKNHSNMSNLGDDISRDDRNTSSDNTNDTGAIKIHQNKRRKSFDGRKFSNEVRLSALQKLDEGESKASIAKKLGVGITTLGLWSRKRSSKPKSFVETKNEGIKIKINGLRKRKKHTYSLEQKVKFIGKIDSGEDISTVAESDNLNINTALAWWNRREKILRKSKQSNLSTSKVFTSQDESTVKIFHDGEKETNISNNTIDSLEQPETKSLEKVQSIMHVVKEPIEEKHQRGRRHNISNICQQSPIPNGRLYMPLEVKQSAIKRIEEGATQVEVARDLDMSLSTVASWWRKKGTLLQNLEDKKLQSLAVTNKIEIVVATKVVPKEKIQADAEVTAPIDANGGISHVNCGISHVNEGISHVDGGISHVNGGNVDVNDRISDVNVGISDVNAAIDANGGISDVNCGISDINGGISDINAEISVVKGNSVSSILNNEFPVGLKKRIELLDVTVDVVGNHVDKTEQKYEENVNTTSESTVMIGIAEIKESYILTPCSTLSLSDNVNDKLKNDSPADVGLLSSMKSAFNESKCDTEEISAEREGTSEPEITSASISPETSDSNIETPEPTISELTISSSPDKGDVDTSVEIVEKIFETANSIHANVIDNSLISQEDPAEASFGNNPFSTNEMIHEEEPLGDANEPNIDLHLLKPPKDVLSNDNMHMGASLIDKVKSSQINEVENMEEIEEIDNQNVVTVADILEQSIPIIVHDDVVSRTSTPSPDNPRPGDIKAAKVVKKKSLDFLANSLMKKALARSQTQLTPLPSELCQSSSSSSSSNHCQLVQENQVLSQTSQIPQSSPTSPSPSVPQSSGLGLIVASYCSSEDEL